MHLYSGEVKFSEVDSFDVVHNIAYLYWIEWARTQYLFDIAGTRGKDFFSKNLPLMTVHTEIDYHSSLSFSDKYHVVTMVEKIGFSSISFTNFTFGETGIVDVSSLISNISKVLSLLRNENQEKELLNSKLTDLELKLVNSCKSTLVYVDREDGVPKEFPKLLKDRIFSFEGYD
ncbi:MAG: hypothetical protein Kapaf2KO_14570 [Candidatus Kapaibacteriales bacterium]